MFKRIDRRCVVAAGFIFLLVVVDVFTLFRVVDKGVDKLERLRERRVVQAAVLLGAADAKDDRTLNADERLKRYTKLFDKKVNDIIAGKYYFINLNGALQKMLGKQMIEDADPQSRVIKLRNGYLTFLYPFRNPREQVQRVLQFQASLAERDIPLLYVQAPFKIDPRDSQLPACLTDTTNRVADVFIEQISGAVDVLDLRKEIAAAGLDHYALFFRTDHHWKPEAAFWAYGKLRERLREKYGFSIDPAKGRWENYVVDEYPAYFLGSQGKRTGMLYAEVDDISVIYPKYETEFVFSVPEKGIVRSGSFRRAMFDEQPIATRDYFGKSPYHAYTGGDFPLNIIVNKKSDNGKKILLIRDSFSCALAPFLAQDCARLDIVDLRYYRNGSLLAYIDQIRPDLVMIEYNPSILCTGEEHERCFQFE